MRLADTKHARLKTFAKARSVSLNKLLEECATQALAQQDVQASDALPLLRGDRQQGLELLNKLDEHFSADKAVGL